MNEKDLPSTTNSGGTITTATPIENIFPNLNKYGLPDDLDMGRINEEIYTEEKIFELTKIVETITTKDMKYLNDINDKNGRKIKIKNIALKLRNLQAFVMHVEQNTIDRRNDILTMVLKNFINAAISRLESEIKNADIILNTQLELNDFSKYAKIMTEYGKNPTLESLKNAYEESRKLTTNALKSGGGGGGGGSSGNNEFPFDVNLILKSIKTEPNENTTFNEVIGANSIKQKLRAVIKLADERASIIMRFDRSLLLYGPPGTGKTLTVTAFANESNRTLYSLTGATLLSSYIGDSEKILKAVFDDAARQPSIVFIDEIDTFFSARSSETSNSSSGGSENPNGTNNTSDTLQSQLFTLLSGVDSDRYNNVFFIAATNRTNALDTALWRRMKQKIFIPLPNKEQRREILEFYLITKNKTILSNDFDFNAVLENTAFLSNSDLKLLSDTVLENKATEILTSEYFQAGYGNLFYLPENKNINQTTTAQILLLPTSNKPNISSGDVIEELPDCAKFLNNAPTINDKIFYKFPNNIIRSHCDFIGYKLLSNDDFNSDIIKSVASSNEKLYYNLLIANNFNENDAKLEVLKVLN